MREQFTPVEKQVQLGKGEGKIELFRCKMHHANRTRDDVYRISSDVCDFELVDK